MNRNVVGAMQEVYELGDHLRNSYFRLYPQSAIATYLRSDRVQPDEVMRFSWMMGRTEPRDIIICAGNSLLIHRRVVELFRAAGLTGWAVYPAVFRHHKRDVTDYFGLIVTGRGGPDRVGQTPMGDRFAVRTWDGSDFFVPEQVAVLRPVYITARVAELIARERLRDVDVRPAGKWQLTPAQSKWEVKAMNPYMLLVKVVRDGDSASQGLLIADEVQVVPAPAQEMEADAVLELGPLGVRLYRAGAEGDNDNLPLLPCNLVVAVSAGDGFYPEGFTLTSYHKVYRQDGERTDRQLLGQVRSWTLAEAAAIEELGWFRYGEPSARHDELGIALIMDLESDVLPLVTVVSKGKVTRLEGDTRVANSTDVPCVIEIEGIQPERAFAVMNILGAEGVDLSWRTFETLSQDGEPVYCLWGSGRYQPGRSSSSEEATAAIIAQARFAGAGDGFVRVQLGDGADIVEVKDGVRPALALEN